MAEQTPQYEMPPGGWHPTGLANPAIPHHYLRSRTGLLHLRAVGVEEATLYVDGDNAPAIATYQRLGFERSAIDVMYAAGDARA